MEISRRGVRFVAGGRSIYLGRFRYPLLRVGDDEPRGRVEGGIDYGLCIT